MGCTASTTDTSAQNNNNPTVDANNLKKDYNSQVNGLDNQNRADPLSAEDEEEEEVEEDHGFTEHEAAVKIQSNYRGYKSRKQISQQSIDNTNHTMKEDESPKNETDEHKAATTIQAGYKGYKTRKEIKKQKSESGSEEGSPKKGDKGSVTDEIADIDLNDPEVEKAATKIQATFRGYKSRREPKQE